MLRIIVKLPYPMNLLRISYLVSQVIYWTAFILKGCFNFDLWMYNIVLDCLCYYPSLMLKGSQYFLLK